jgi:hypothetical protein
LTVVVPARGAVCDVSGDATSDGHVSHGQVSDDATSDDATSDDT